ncbi:hypothetical protein GOP47_0004862 [Adiantum capillus-veneris]|uniref:Remorin C-terminal domain-containing protein n=1 Tax=Adiantum capillus-veneris TaxID=13818 RepID=A0A9D4V526_ADICA|nr:hypothetical protein GOP47_0004862 [Adiantum capillus-veneris]
MLNSTSSSTTPALSSSCNLNSPNHNSKPPIIASPSAQNAHAQNPPHPHHTALVVPLSPFHHFHTHPNLHSSHDLYPLPLGSIDDNTNNSATRHSGIACESFSSHGMSTDPHCYTTDCSPRSVIRPVHSSSSGPSPDPGRPNSLSTHCIGNARAPRSKSHNLVSSRLHHNPAHHGKHRVSSMQGQNKQMMMQNHPHASAERRHTMVSLVQNADHTHHNPHHEAETEEGNNQDIKVSRSPKSGHQEDSVSVNWHRERLDQPSYSFGTAAVDKPCVNIASKEANGFDSGLIQAAAMEASRLRSDTQICFGSEAHVHRYTRVPIASSGPLSFNSMQVKSVDHKEKIPQHRSHSCNLVNVKGDPRISSRQGPKQPQNDHTKTSFDELASKSPDAIHPNTKGHTQFGTKWDDAEKWLRPANHHHHHHHATGCRGLIPSLGLLRMSDCLNFGTASKPHCMNPLPVSAPSPMDYVAAHSNCALPPLANCMNHHLHAPFRSATNSHHDWRSGALGQADIPVDHPPLPGTRQCHHVDYFHPHVISCNVTNISYAEPCSPSPHTATNPMQLHVIDDTEKESQAQQLEHQYGSSGSSVLKSNASIAREHNYSMLHWEEKNQGRDYLSIETAVPSVMESKAPTLPRPGSAQPCTANQQFTDRVASGECMPCSSDQLVYSIANDRYRLMGPGIQGTVAMPMVSLREVGTQMSSVDGSGSISRFTSKNGSPQKILSPARHNTPARGRSLGGSASSSGNVRRNTKQFINLEELVECHRAKLELQALSEGDRINSFHRTTSNWSSREVEEADLSRSLRHSTPELENSSSTGFSHQWPTQSYSWNKDDNARLARLQVKEAQIQAWEDKKKSKADAKLKRLEENLAKKRSQTTTRVMESLAAAQRKAEEMRATIYAQQRRPIKKGHQFRPRSLSPISRCTCFSVLQ